MHEMCVFIHKCILTTLAAAFHISGSNSQCPSKSWFLWKERCYYIAPSRATYADSKARFDNLGASLAVPNSKEEHDFIHNITSAHSMPNIYYMFLGCERQPSNEWYCVDGFYLGLHDISGNMHEPNMLNFWQKSQRSSPSETVLIVAARFTGGNVVGSWHDASPAGLLGSVCERAILFRKTMLMFKPTVQKNIFVSFPHPDANHTDLKSIIGCFSTCSHQINCKGINFNRKTGACNVFLESLWIFNFISETGWSYIEA